MMPTQEEEDELHRLRSESEAGEFGQAFTGRTARPGPLRSIVEPTPEAAAAPSPGEGFLANPADRAALISIGLQMMQPVAFGQTVGGHIGQAIGAGGESASAASKQELLERQAQSKLDIANERLQLAQQGHALRAARGLGRGRGGATGKPLTEYQRLQEERRGETDITKAREKEEKSDLAEAEWFSAQSDINPAFKQYAGKSPQAIARELRSAREAAGGGGGAGAVPPAAQREAGKVYPTPKGNLKWTGTGWVQP